MNAHEKINYLEFPSRNLDVTKDFLQRVFGWKFVDYGAEYTAFAEAGIDGGFYQSHLNVSADNGSVLVVLYSDDLEQTQQKIEAAGGAILKPVFSFPGGRRFHFCDPNGNEYAVWSDVGAEPQA